MPAVSLLVAALAESRCISDTCWAKELAPVSAPHDLGHVSQRCSASSPPVLGVDSQPLFVKWEEYIGRYLHDIENISFVMVGANCGRNNLRCAVGGDPVWEYATQCAGWQGVVIEPISETFEELRAAYRPYPVLPLRVAVSDHAGVGTMLVEHELSILSSLGGSDATSRRTETVPLVTLADFWPGSGFVILAIDAEGSEPKILGSPLPRPRPRLVLFEMVSLNASQLAAIDTTLVAQGYEHVHDLHHKDDYAVRHGLPPQDRLYGIPLPAV
eukprot:880196-Prymnesium_polylepis.1